MRFNWWPGKKIKEDSEREVLSADEMLKQIAEMRWTEINRKTYAPTSPSRSRRNDDHTADHASFNVLY